jgi:hypothetical protein
VKLTKPSEAGLKGSNTSAATPVWDLGQSVRAALCNNDPACLDAIEEHFVRAIGAVRPAAVCVNTSWPADSIKFRNR